MLKSADLGFSFVLYYFNRDADLVRRIGVATALEVRGTGIPYVFAPCVAVSPPNNTHGG